MDFQSAEEIVNFLGAKGGIFKVLQEGFEQQKMQNETLQAQVDELTVQLGDMMLGGGL